MKQPLRIGILGAANIAQRVLLEPAKQFDNIVVAGIAARSRERAELFAQTHAIPRVYDSYVDLIESDQIDAVYIPLANHVHTEWIVRVAQAKKPILVEKPICLTVAEFEAIEAAVTANKVLLLETIMVQHHPWQATVRDIVASKRYGALRSTKTEVSFRLRDVAPTSYRLFPDLGGGVFFDVGSYWVQFVQACIGQLPTRLDAQSAFAGPNGIDMTFEAQMTFADGAFSEFLCSFERGFAINHWVELDEARLRIRNFFRPNFGNQVLTLDVWRGEEREKIKFPAQNYYTNQLAFFEKAVRGDVQAPPLAQMRERVALMANAITVARENHQLSRNVEK